MKLFAILATFATAQDGPGAADASRAMSLDKKIDNARTKCQYYMNKAMVCHPPSAKIGKYTHRFDKVRHSIQISRISGKYFESIKVFSVRKPFRYNFQ